MLSQSYYHSTTIKRVKDNYPDAVLYAVSLGKYRYISSEKWKDTFVHLKELAPSESLLKDYKSKKISWEEYIPRFTAEMNNPRSKAAMLEIAKEAAEKHVFLFCHCGPKEGKKCHRFLIMDMIFAAAKEEGIELNRT